MEIVPGISYVLLHASRASKQVICAVPGVVRNLMTGRQCHLVEFIFGQRCCRGNVFILTTSARARKQQHCIVGALYVKFPFIWPSHLSVCNCFLLLVWWWSRLHKHCLTGKIRMISQWLKGNLCEITGNNFSPLLTSSTNQVNFLLHWFLSFLCLSVTIDSEWLIMVMRWIPSTFVALGDEASTTILWKFLPNSLWNFLL